MDVVPYFRRITVDRNQPAQKLHDATVYATMQAAARDLEGQLARLTLKPSNSKPARDRRVILGGFTADLKCCSIILSHLFAVGQAMARGPAGSSINNGGGNPTQKYVSFLQDCRTLNADCKQASLPKLSVEVSCYSGKVARALQMYSHGIKTDIDKANEVVQEEVRLLEVAKELCKQPLQRRRYPRRRNRSHHGFAR
ncbi:uncharacterized protein RAG0_01330 [Rhynchosporium agropyri]|uniref:Uncharacterized protein n=1 Tax=Rhynchosporium agropyri TaxID=914238 RepID=A0A1E1JWS9_9HELO|nr:uncharacterized protein RAG0_01330 [Rhynchosporium agropyri]